MKKELGDQTRRFFLCLSFSSSAGGFSRSMSFWSTCNAAATKTTPIRTLNPTRNARSRKDTVGSGRRAYHGGRRGFAPASPRSMVSGGEGLRRRERRRWEAEAEGKVSRVAVVLIAKGWRRFPPSIGCDLFCWAHMSVDLGRVVAAELCPITRGPWV